MGKNILTILLLLSTLTVGAENAPTNQEQTATEIKSLRMQQATMHGLLTQQNTKIRTLQAELRKSHVQLDSQAVQIASLKSSFEGTKAKVANDINVTNQSVVKNSKQVNNEIRAKSLWGVAIVILVVAVFSLMILLLRKKSTANSLAIDDIHEAQNKLQKTLKAMQEESAKLDNKIIEVMEKNLQDEEQDRANEAQTDHTLALRVADEISRIENNLSRMDHSVRGYKQLSKAVERIKDDFEVKGYEISDLLGKPYDEGMEVIANFVMDDNLPEGTRTITGITKAQVLYNGKMIQMGQITVTQNI